MMNFVYLCLGAILGATGRWGLTLLLNPIVHILQLGTLSVNYLGCLLMGIMLAVMTQSPQLSSEWKLFFMTGFFRQFYNFFFFFCGNRARFTESKIWGSTSGYCVTPFRWRFIYLCWFFYLAGV